jgi:hypothetical protein
MVQAASRAAARVEVVEAVPYFGRGSARTFHGALGVAEVALGAWVLTGLEPRGARLAQTVLLVTLNANGLVWSRHIIHDPAGMIVKNSAFLVLVWVAAGLPASRERHGARDRVGARPVRCAKRTEQAPVRSHVRGRGDRVCGIRARWPGLLHRVGWL